MPIGNGGIIGPANVPTITTASGVWSLREQQQAQGRGAWPLAIAPDPYFEYTTLLLPGNGTDGANNNTFLDGSTNNFTITRNGNTTQGTFSPFSQTGWGNYLPTTSERLTTASSSSDFSFGTGNFTVEGFVNLSSASNCMVFQMSTAATGYNSSNTNSVCFYIGGTGKLEIFANNAAFASTNVLVTSSDIGKWYHFAIVRSSGSTTVYWNGSAVAGLTSIADSANYTMTYCVIGTVYNNTYSLQGYLSNFRVLKGTAQYSGSSLTVPTAPFATGTTNQVLLTCQANRFVDSNTATTAKTITVTGSPRVVAFSPFNPTLPWSSATNGGSGYFDGSGDYLSVPANSAWNLGSGSFCIECWSYPTATQSDRHLFSLNSSGGTGYWILRYNTGTIPQFIYNNYTVSITSSTAAVINAWNHIAMVSNGTTMSLYLNGARVATGSATSINDGSANPLLIGSQLNVSSREISGYFTDGRVVKGSSVYDPTLTSLTVPTAPLTAITNTSLLLNFTNAGIYDATSKNDLETLDNTVNGVRISTAQSQFGGSSIYFDGTGTDYLWIQADQPFQRFGTAPFTIELWIRLAATGSARGLVAKGTSTTGWLVSLNTSNQVVFTYGTSTITSTGTIPASAWRYIAVVREGTGANQTKIYISGVNDGTGTVSTDFTQTSSMYIGADRTGGSLFSGYIQDVRITNGYARTVTTIPTTAFPVI